MTTRKAKGPTSAPTLNRAGSTNPTKDKEMNSTEPSTMRGPNKGRRNSLLALIEQRTEAMKLDVDAWNKVGDVEDSSAMDALPLVRVQVGRLRRGYDEAGKPIEEPIWAHSAEQIRSILHKDFDAYLTFIVPKTGPLREKAEADCDARLQAKLDELAALQAQADRIKLESGYTEALSIARATMAAAKRIDRAIIGYVPKTFDEAVALASWAIDARKEAFTHLEDEDFALVLASIASAKVPAAREVAA